MQHQARNGDAEPEPELDDLRAVTRATSTIIGRSDSAIRRWQYVG